MEILCTGGGFHSFALSDIDNIFRPMLANRCKLAGRQIISAYVSSAAL